MSAGLSPDRISSREVHRSRGFRQDGPEIPRQDLELAEQVGTSKLFHQIWRQLLLRDRIQEQGSLLFGELSDVLDQA
jgi:hypothetical protein